jgi:phosphoribosylformylglycinamidine synthase
MRLERAHDRRLLESCHDLSDGGLAVALAEVTFGGVGATVTLPPSDLPLQAQLFAETHSRFLVSVRPQRAPELEEVMGGDCQRLGRAGGDRVSITAASGERLVDLAVTDLLDAFRRGLLEAE